MATLKGETIASTYDLIVKRHETYVQTGTNIELMTDSSGATAPTGLYLESGATTDNVGIGVADPDSTLEILDTTTQLKLSYDATNYASFSVAADGLLNIVTVDPDGAEADICLNPDGNVGIGTTAPATLLHMEDAGTVSLRIVSSDDTGCIIDFGDSANAAVGRIAYTHSNNTMQFKTANANAMIINTSGYVGIGTTDPDAKLHIVSSAEGGVSDGGANAAQLLVEGTGTTAGSFSPTIALLNSSAGVDGDTIGALQFLGDDETGDATGDTSVSTKYASVFAKIIDATDASATGSMSLATVVSGTNTVHMYMAEGKVGIGPHGAPTSMLEIKPATLSEATTIATAMNNGIKLNMGTSVDNNEFAPAISWYSDDAQLDADGTEDSIGAITMQAAEDFNASNDSGADMRFYTHKIATGAGLTEKMCILANGNVGIGTTAPNALLSLKTDTSMSLVDTTFTGDAIYIDNSGISEGDDVLGSAIVWGEHAVHNRGAAITSVQTDGDNDEVGLAFYTSEATHGEDLNETMRMEGSGNVGIGSATPSYRLTVSDNAAGFVTRIENSNTGATADGLLIKLGHATPTTGDFIRFVDSGDVAHGEIVGNGASAVAYNTASDYRMKEDIVDMPSVLNMINELKPRTFKWKADSEKTEYGFIAHELQEVIPLAVHGVKDAIYDDVPEDDVTYGKDKLQSINKPYLVAILTKAVQELSAKVTALEGEDSSSDTKIAALEAEDTANKAKIVALEAKDAEYATAITALTERIATLESA